MPVYEWTAREIRDRTQSGEIAVEEVMRNIFDRIREVEPHVRAFLSLAEDQAVSRARSLDSVPLEERGKYPLFGVPVAVKDNIVTKTMETTAASRILQGFMPPYDATVVEKLLAAGAIIVGKTNLDEFAMGSSTEHSAYQKTKNPWDLGRVPGGSSGGSAAAVAARMVPVALGSDTGGSIRQPASYCGVIGFKPTYGRVSRYGLIAFASSLDQIGPFGRTVEDVALVTQAISGPDRNDSTSLRMDLPPMDLGSRTSLKDMKIGIPREYFGDGMDARVRTTIEEALERVRALGGELVEISLPHTQYAIATYYLIAPAEASSNLSRYDGVRYGQRVAGDDLLTMYENTRENGFGPEVKRRILLGTHALSAGYYDAYYLKAQKVRTLIRQDFERAFGQVDVIITPTTPDLPFKFGERDQDPLQMYLSDVYTVTSNLAGIPSVSVPAGLADGLPVGLQWMGPALKDKDLLAASHVFWQQHETREWPLGGRR